MTFTAILVGLGVWLVLWLVPILSRYERTRRRDWLLVLGLYVCRPGHLPPCDARHAGDVAVVSGERWRCEPTTSTWYKETSK